MKSAFKSDGNSKSPNMYSMRRVCHAPLRPSQKPTKGKSRGVEDPFGRSPEGAALGWGAGAKPLLAGGDTRGSAEGALPPLPPFTVAIHG